VGILGVGTVVLLVTAALWFDWPREPRLGAWHAARTTLFLSWAGFGLLSRAVHCNSGRPEPWALPPCG
jgi:hypothetical protein